MANSEPEGVGLAFNAPRIDSAIAMALQMIDFIYESGSANGWNYLKLYSGISVCWSYFWTGEMTMTAAYDIWLSDIKRVEFPANLFIEMPIPIVQVVAGGALIGAKATGATNKDHLDYQVSRAWNNGDGTYIAALCIGNWK